MAISADSIYSETLQSIINAKLEELVRKKDAYESSKASVLQAYSSQTDEAERVRILRDGIKTCFKLRTKPDGKIIGDGVNDDLQSLLQNLDRFLEQPRYDPSLSSRQLETWAASLRHYLDVQSNRYEFASLYAKLVTEWLVSEKRIGNKDEDAASKLTESYEELESAAKLKSRQEWEKVVFQSFEVDREAVRDLLQHVFGEGNGNKALAKALKHLRHDISEFEATLAAPLQFNPPTLKWVIQGLLSGNILSEDKRTVLKDFLNNHTILIEVADVLNLRMANITSWNWGSTVPIVQQRQLAGQYSIYMQEDLLQAIFLQYIGVQWSVFMKKALKDFVKMPEVFIPAGLMIPKIAMKRQEYYVGRVSRKLSLQYRRNNLWLQKYFLTQLPTSPYSRNAVEDGAEEADFDGGLQAPSTGRTKQTARKSTGGMAPRKQLASKSASMAVQSQPGFHAYNPSRAGTKRRRVVQDETEESELWADSEEEEEEDDSYSIINLKQGLLHLLRTEILVNTRLHGELSGFRAQFSNWNSLLPHVTALTVAEYLGVSKPWLQFFQSFLQAPLGFVIDGVVEDARVRRRGVPGSHPLSDVLGEMILFCLDLGVNQATTGHQLWRVHDDLWFWSVDHGACIKAWSFVTKFADTMGLNLDENKAGSVRVMKDKSTPITIDDSLPPNQIRWGFLYLDSQSGQWEIDETLVDVHTDELRKQLDGKSDSVLSWVQAWNAYANTFFTTNFGPTAKCFGRAHTTKVLQTLSRVQTRLFEHDGIKNVVAYLQQTLADRFGTSDVPEGYYFFPTELGGLELRNPFINLLLAHDTLDRRDEPEQILDRFDEAEREQYEILKKFFEKDQVSRDEVDDPGFVPPGHDADTFMSFEEFTRYREVINYDYGNDLRDSYEELIERCGEFVVSPLSDIKTALGQLRTGGGMTEHSTGIHGNWNAMNAYWRWVAQMYGPEIVQRFGGLNMVDNGVLPIGMVSLFRSDRVQWRA